jgi:hypothetical protein
MVGGPSLFFKNITHDFLNLVTYGLEKTET